MTIGGQAGRAVAPQGIIGLLGNLAHIAGPAVVRMTLLGLPVGLAIGALEIIFGAHLQTFLAHYGLMPEAQGFLDMQVARDHPTEVLLILTLLVAIGRYAALSLPNLVYEKLNTRIRDAVAAVALGGVMENSRITLTEATHLVSDVSPRAATFLNQCVQLATQVCLTLTVLAGMTSLSLPLTALALGAAVVMAVPLILVKRQTQAYSARVYRGTASFTAGMIRDIRNVHFLRLVAANETQRARLEALSGSIMDALVGYIARLSLVGVVPQVVAIAVLVIIIWVNTRFSLASMGVLVPLAYLLSRLAAAMGGIVIAVGQIHYGLSFARELAQWRDGLKPLPCPVPSGAPPLDGPLELCARSLVIGRDRALTEPLSFTARSGDMLLIAAPSGQGKTTLLLSLLGLVPPLDGEVRWNGRVIAEGDLDDLRRHVGYAGADPYLFEGSVADNVVFGTDCRNPDEMRRALEMAEARFVYELPGGPGHMLRESGDGLSAGQKQRLSIARALLRRPRILVLDEATANIDEATEAQILAGIRREFPDTLILAVSHRKSLAAFATRTLTL